MSDRRADPSSYGTSVERPADFDQFWADTIAERPAVKRGRMVNAAWGDLSQQLHERHDASDFDTNTQDKVLARQEAAEAASQ